MYNVELVLLIVNVKGAGHIVLGELCGIGVLGEGIVDEGCFELRYLNLFVYILNFDCF